MAEDDVTLFTVARKAHVFVTTFLYNHHICGTLVIQYLVAGVHNIKLCLA